MQQLNILIETYLTKLHMPTIHKTDVVEIVILAFQKPGHFSKASLLLRFLSCSPHSSI